MTCFMWHKFKYFSSFAQGMNILCPLFPAGQDKKNMHNNIVNSRRDLMISSVREKNIHILIIDQLSSKILADRILAKKNPASVVVYQEIRVARCEIESSGVFAFSLYVTLSCCFAKSLSVWTLLKNNEFL